MEKALEVLWTSQAALIVKRLPTLWEIRVQSLGWEDLLEKEIATHSTILAYTHLSLLHFRATHIFPSKQLKAIWKS